MNTQGTTIHQMINSDPGLLIGPHSYSSVDFSGTIFVDTALDDDYIGVVFNYQSNKRFMLVSWKQREQRYWENTPFTATAKAGVQIQRIRSKTGPGATLRNAIWKTGHTRKEVCVCVCVHVSRCVSIHASDGNFKHSNLPHLFEFN